ncbi:DUF1826 domain-containing protein [Pseudoalteromonas ardens]|uniref:Succinylglutamate desuccinylase n=1 Tax=Pseudoalteromonas rubra TaxID=43658 RepID=A0A0L0ENJ6_9GAMM|nr:DUF1826 domain-containing protein [Pseudoalteromonas sp. R96]KNC65940.1 succinylglutamate desuccinylase [Pseudoalteromonas rubra]MDK1312043.1 DUF1826 domain-containing protein [Pseudoalteromonas sp. R96]
MTRALATNDNSMIPANRYAAISPEPNVLTDIYREEINLSVWQCTLTQTLNSEVTNLLSNTSELQLSIAATPEQTIGELHAASALLVDKPALTEHLAMLVDMFCTLFELKRAGLRLTILNKAMCPKFHVDHIPCRLVSTLGGVASQWLPHDTVDRSKLGAGSKGKKDHESGIYTSESDIQQLNAGDVALLKGSGWLGNEDGALVHRSPAPVSGETRLLLTLDFID